MVWCINTYVPYDTRSLCCIPAQQHSNAHMFFFVFLVIIFLSVHYKTSTTTTTFFFFVFSIIVPSSSWLTINVGVIPQLLPPPRSSTLNINMLAKRRTWQADRRTEFSCFCKKGLPKIYFILFLLLSFGVSSCFVFISFWLMFSSSQQAGRPASQLVGGRRWGTFVVARSLSDFGISGTVNFILSPGISFDIFVVVVVFVYEWMKIFTSFVCFCCKQKVVQLNYTIQQ